MEREMHRDWAATSWPPPNRRHFMAALGGGALLALLGPGRAGAQAASLTAYLTFDDGPGRTTSQVRTILDDAGVPGTFFVVGTRVADHVSLLRSMVRDGHSIQNHSWSHVNLTKHRNPRRELRLCNDAVAEATGRRPRYLRPPFGATNRRLVRASRDEGLRQVLWNVSTTGPISQRDPMMHFRERIDPLVEARRQANILFHDGSGQVARMVAFLPKAVSELQNLGFEFRAFI